MTPQEPTARRLHVLVGLDGSEESVGALRRAVDLLSASIGTVTLAVALDYDGDLSNVPDWEEAQAQALLRDRAGIVTEALGIDPATVVLVGRPADALVKYAQDAGCDLIVVGPRGRGASRLLFGSVATHLAKCVGRVPVAILPAIADA